MRRQRITSTSLAVVCLCLALVACSDKAAESVLEAPGEAGEAQTMFTAEAARGWPTYGGQPSGTQYSSLNQINLDNVDELDIAWTYHTGEVSTGSEETDATTHQVTPIHANNMLYLCSPYNNIIALDPGSGEEIWRFDPKKTLTGTMYGSHVCRGVSYWQADDDERNEFCGKRVFEGVTDGRLVAVDGDTGVVCGNFGNNGEIDLRALDYKGEGLFTTTSPPAIYKDVVIIGGTVIDNKWEDSLDGIVRGFDVRTGEEIWSWNPIPEHLSDKVGGANTWAPISIDQDNGWVFLPTGSPSYDVLGVNRTEPIPHGNAVVALDALTGKLIWSYQTVHHDLWDYDLPAMPTLIDVEHNGEQVAAVMQPTKTGFIFLLDRMTGEPLFPIEEKAVPQTNVPGEYSSPTQPFPTLPAPVTSQYLTPDDAWGAIIVDKNECRKKLVDLRNEGLFTPPSIAGSVLHPSFLGGTNWGGIAYDEESGIAVVNSSNLVASVRLVPKQIYDAAVHRQPGAAYYEMRGSPYVLLRQVLMSSLGAPCNPPPWGRLTAINMNSGETLWQVPFGRVEFAGPITSLESWGAPNQGGPIVTRGGLIFIGASLDSKIRAYDIKSGEEVWAGDLPVPAIATPMTYEYGGKQFVVIAAGGNADFQTDVGDAIVAFALKE